MIPAERVYNIELKLSNVAFSLNANCRVSVHIRTAEVKRETEPVGYSYELGRAALECVSSFPAKIAPGQPYKMVLSIVLYGDGTKKRFGVVELDLEELTRTCPSPVVASKKLAECPDPKALLALEVRWTGGPSAAQAPPEANFSRFQSPNSSALPAFHPEPISFGNHSKNKLQIFGQEADRAMKLRSVSPTNARFRFNTNDPDKQNRSDLGSNTSLNTTNNHNRSKSNAKITFNQLGNFNTSENTLQPTTNFNEIQRTNLISQAPVIKPPSISPLAAALPPQINPLQSELDQTHAKCLDLEKNMDVLKSQLAAGQERLASQETRIRQLQQIIDGQIQSGQEKIEEVNQLQAQNVNLSVQVKQAGAEMTSLKQKLEAMRTELGQGGSNYQNSMIENQRLAAELHRKEIEVATLHQQLIFITQEKEQLLLVPARGEQRLQAEVQLLKQANESLEGQLRQREALLLQSPNKDAVIKEIAEWQGRLQVAESRLAASEAAEAQRMEEQSRRLSQETARREQLEDVNRRLQQDFAELSSKLEAATREQLNSERRLHELANRPPPQESTQMARALQEKEKEVESLGMNVFTLSKNLEMNRKIVQDLNNRLDAADREIIDYQMKVVNLRNQLDEAKSGQLGQGVQPVQAPGAGKASVELFRRIGELETKNRELNEALQAAKDELEAAQRKETRSGPMFQSDDYAVLLADNESLRRRLRAQEARAAEEAARRESAAGSGEAEAAALRVQVEKEAKVRKDLEEKLRTTQEMYASTEKKFVVYVKKVSDLLNLVQTTDMPSETKSRFFEYLC